MAIYTKLSENNLKEFFLFMEKKNINEVIMHTKNVLRYLFQSRAELK